jgi:hypothetical protein
MKKIVNCPLSIINLRAVRTVKPVGGFSAPNVKHKNEFRDMRINKMIIGFFT